MRESAYSLIEMIVAIGVFAVIMALATTILATSVRNSQKSDALNLIRQDIDAVADTMSRNINNAVEVLECGSNGPHSIIRFRHRDSLASSVSYSCNYDSGANTYYVFNDSNRMTSTDYIISDCSISCNLATVTIELNAKSKASGASQANYVKTLNLHLRNIEVSP